MKDERVNVEELKRAMAADFDRLAAAMNAAKDGSIISDTEEPVRDANTAFRERTYAKTIRLLQDKQEAFSPSAPRTQEQGPTPDDASDGERASLCA